MIKFDKLKLITSIEYISDIKHDSFNIILRHDEVLYYKYQQKTPYSLLIMVDYSKNELIIEFSGKILQEHYISLISKETIRECFNKINDIGICELDTESIINDSIVAKCDITKDIKADINQIIPSIKQNIINYSKWNIKPYYSGVVVENVVATTRYKKRLAIYDKWKELQQGNSRCFIEGLNNKEEVLAYYKDKIRFELNLNTMYQVRQFLNIPNNNIQSVLNAVANPILSIIDETVKYEHQRHKEMTLRDYERVLLIESCDYDLAKVEAKVRAYSKKSTSITRAMQPYKDLFHQLKTIQNTEIDIRKLVC
ncbi:MAG: hypothetical protein K2J42_07720 [Muribaculaceae bacterium]|nr:hypothetical protein [Muribaculaceae bacterium]